MQLTSRHYQIADMHSACLTIYLTNLAAYAGTLAVLHSNVLSNLASIQFGFDNLLAVALPISHIIGQMSLSPSFYSLVPQIPIFILVDVAYTCQLNGNIRTAIYNRQTLNIIWQYCDQSFGFKIVLNDENSLLLFAFVTLSQGN